MLFGVTMATASMPSGALGLGLGHLLERAVAALRIEAELGRRRLGARRIGRQRAGDQLELAVHARGDAVHAADEGALPAAHHAERIGPVLPVAASPLSPFQFPPACASGRRPDYASVHPTGGPILEPSRSVKFPASP